MYKVYESTILITGDWKKYYGLLTEAKNGIPNSYVPSLNGKYVCFIGNISRL